MTHLFHAIFAIAVAGCAAVVFWLAVMHAIAALPL